MVKGKQGFLRIAEAGVAILIILGAILINYKNLTSLKEPDFSENARDILEEIAKDNNLRNEILTNQDVNQNTKDFVRNNLPNFLEFEIRACTISSVCGQSTYQGSVFSAERIISSNLQIFTPVKLRLFIWQEGF